MRKLLQNKAVVAGLGVVAAACVVGNFVQWPARKGALPVAARNSSEVPNIDPTQFPIRAALRIAGNLAGWQDPAHPLATARDPFQPILGPNVRSNSVVVATVPSAPPTFVVQAISVDGEKALAVVNRRVLAAGDRIEGYVVEKIQPNQVHLRGPEGPLTVSIGDPRRPTRVPPAK